MGCVLSPLMGFWSESMKMPKWPLMRFGSCSSAGELASAKELAAMKAASKKKAPAAFTQLLSCRFRPGRFRNGRCRSGQRRMPIVNLKKHLAAFDHAEFAARALFNGIAALFEIAHFSIHHRVAHLCLLVDLFLRLNLPVKFPHLEPASLAQP